MKQHRAILTLCLLLFALLPNSVDARTWTNRESGKTVDAEFVSAADGSVELKRDRDGKVFSLSIERLTDADQTYVAAKTTKAPWEDEAAPEPEKIDAPTAEEPLAQAESSELEVPTPPELEGFEEDDEDAAPAAPVGAGPGKLGSMIAIGIYLILSTGLLVGIGFTGKLIFGKKDEESPFYQHSGKFGPATIVLPAGLLFVCASGGLLYSYIAYWNPLIYISFLITMAYGSGMAYIIKKALIFANIRNTPLAMAMGAFFGITTVYASWAGFVVALGNGRMGLDLTIVQTLGSPLGVWMFASAVAETGWYNIFGGDVSGWVCWILWFLEALIEKNFAPLKNCPTSGSYEASSYRLDTTWNPNDNTFVTISLVHRQETVDDEGKTETTITPLFRHLVLSPAEFAELGETLKGGPATPAAI